MTGLSDTRSICFCNKLYLFLSLWIKKRYMKFHWIDVRGNLFSLWIKWEYFNLKKKPTSEKELALSIYSKMILKFYQA